MHSPRTTGGLKIVDRAASVWARGRTFACVALGWLLVLGVAACAGDDYEEPAVTTAAPRRDSAPATTAAPLATMAPQTTEAYFETESDERSYVEQTTATTAHAAPAATAAPTTDAMADEAQAMAEEAQAMAEEPSDSYAPATTAAATTTGAYRARASEASPSATTFKDYQRSRFVSASRDRISTFSLDTDRTSFQLALNWARQGYEVDPDSVRPRSGSTRSTTDTSTRPTSTTSGSLRISSGIPWTTASTWRVSGSRRRTSGMTGPST